MRKADKKIENSLRIALTEICHIAQEKYSGFKWLTHFANYSDFPGSLSIICIYDLNSTLLQTDKEALQTLLKKKLASININIKNIRKHVYFDTEENCQEQNDGQWKERLQKYY